MRALAIIPIFDDWVSVAELVMPLDEVARTGALTLHVLLVDDGSTVDDRGRLAGRTAHRLLTGEHVRVGNFCAIPAAQLPRLVAVSQLWNHFAVLDPAIGRRAGKSVLAVWRRLGPETVE